MGRGGVTASLIGNSSNRQRISHRLLRRRTRRWPHRRSLPSRHVAVPTGARAAGERSWAWPSSPVAARVAATGPTEASAHASLPTALPDGVPSWEEIVREHSTRVYRLAYRLTGNPHDAEDLTQEVFVRVFRSLHTYTPDNFPGWLHRITTNLFLDRARRRCADPLRRTRRRRRSSGCRRPRPASERDAHAMRCSTPTSRWRWPRSRRSSGRPSCCATSKVCRTRRSPRRWTSSSAPCGPGSTVAAAAARRAGPPGTSPGHTRFSGPLDPVTVAT